MKCIECNEELVYIPNIFWMQYGHFECKNGHYASFYTVLAREMVEITPMKNPNIIRELRVK